MIPELTKSVDAPVLAGLNSLTIAAVEASADRGLGIDEKCVVRGGAGKPTQAKKAKQKQLLRSEFENMQRDRWAMKAKAAALLRHDDDMALTAKRLSFCRRVPFSKENVKLQAHHRADGAVTASFSGLQTCASVWCCPFCSENITAKRKAEVDAAMQWARQNGYAVAFVTYTARHKKTTKLLDFLADLRSAQRTLRQSTSWRRLPIVGSITALEVTHSEANGFHPHSHQIVFLQAGESEALAMMEGLRPAWAHALACVGRDGTHEAAWDVQDASAAGTYLAKWAAASEMTLAHKKKGRGEGSRNSWQLLEDAVHGDVRAGKLFVEFAQAFRGRRQLQWSQGLRAAVGVDEISDADAADMEPEPQTIVKTVILREWSAVGDAWTHARRRMVALLAAARYGGDLDDAEFGESDFQKWRRLQLMDTLAVVEVE